MKPILADTGPLYALADPSDQYHSRARKDLERIEREGWYPAVTYLTVAEAYSLVLKRLGRAYAQGWLKQLIRGSAAINPEPSDYLAAIARVQRYRDQALTLFDAVLAEVSHRVAVPIWTYDHHFEVMRCHEWR
jgi:predicted nucleic acid-binding protein